MKLLIIFVALTLSLQSSEAQFFNAIRNLFGGSGGGGGGFNLFGGSRFRDDGTQSPVSTGKDELFPTDCGRDPSKGTGKLCFPDGQLCANRKFYTHQSLEAPNFNLEGHAQRVRLALETFIQFVGGGYGFSVALHLLG